MPLFPLPSDAGRTEGDVNLSERRRAWQRDHLDDGTRRLLSDDAAVFLRQALSTPCLDVLTGCEGIYLIDAQGRRIMDFHGNNVHQVGYGHPTVVAAVKRQLDTLPFCPRRFANAPATALAKRLTAVAPTGLDRVLFAPGGAEAIGIAIKLVRYATGRHKTISMWGSFHGASLDAISIGGESLFRDGVGPLLPGCFHVAAPRTGDRVEEAVDAIRRVMEAEGEIGAVVAEPMRCTSLDGLYIGSARYAVAGYTYEGTIAEVLVYSIPT